MRGVNGDGLYEADDSQVELLRAVVLCHPGWDRLAAATFVPDSSSVRSWLQWKERVFVPALLSGMERARFAAAAGDCRSLAICDKAIDAALASDLANASRAAGAALMEKYLPPKTERLWMRYRSLQSSGEVPGHLAVVCAVRAVAFHLSPWAMLSAYVFLEAKAGLPRDGFASWVNMVADCLTARQSPKSSDLRAA
jgi:urease accessory protein UreF